MLKNFQWRACLLEKTLKKTLKKKYVYFLIFFIYPTLAWTNVSLKNGNFFISYTDGIYTDGFQPKIERVYNSKDGIKGMFGWGWGSEYEVYAAVSSDGSVLIHEFGGGAENHFVPNGAKESDVEKAVEILTKAEQKAGVFSSGSQLANYRQRLHKESSFRNQEWERLKALKRVEPQKIETGTQLQSNRFSYQFLTKVTGGYIRKYETGLTQKFNDEGHLVRITDKNNNFIVLTYGSDGKLQKIVDNFNKKMFFYFNERGLVKKIEFESKKQANYQYNENDELIRSQDSDGNVYQYRYDAQARHNMTEIIYADKSKMEIQYFGRNNKENVKSVRDPDGTLTEYNYESEGKDGLHYLVGLSVKGSDGKLVSSSRYEYFNKIKANGEEWTQKLINVLDGEKTETTYNECCGLPIVIQTAAGQTQFEYDTRGRVAKKTSPSEETVLTYDREVGKVNRVSLTSLPDRKEHSWSEFSYDNKGNLKLAKNSTHQEVSLFYDAPGRIIAMVDQNKHRLNFKYNENSKPTEITDPSLGTISVSYSNSGEIKDVKSSAGKKVALEVTSAFQNLLAIIRPAGVTLSF